MNRAKDRCQTRQLITFAVVGRRYGVPKESLMAVVPLDSIELAADDETTGSDRTRTARWRGETLPVVDASGPNPRARRNGRDASDGRVLIAVKSRRGAIGIAADRLESVVTYEMNQVSRALEGCPSPLGAVSTRVVDTTGRAIDCVDAAALFET